MQTFRIPFQAMASACEIVVATDAEDEAQSLAQAAINEVHRIEDKYSRYRSDSIVSRINAAASQDPVECDDETWSLLEYADTLYKSSEGLFDITSGVLRRAWDFKMPRLPLDEELASVCQLIGWPRVERERHRVRLPQIGMDAVEASR